MMSIFIAARDHGVALLHPLVVVVGLLEARRECRGAGRAATDNSPGGGAASRGVPIMLVLKARRSAGCCYLHGRVVPLSVASGGAVKTCDYYRRGGTGAKYFSMSSCGSTPARSLTLHLADAAAPARCLTIVTKRGVAPDRATAEVNQLAGDERRKAMPPCRLRQSGSG